jgi:DNA-binding beta-propeller fold protein YncE
MKSKLFVFLFIVCLLAGFSGPIKVKVTVDNASLKATPEIQAKTVARIPLNTVLDAEEKQGEWYKVTLDSEGVKMTGYIHEMLVTVVTGEGEAAAGETLAPGERAQAEVVAEISIKIEDSRNLIRRDNKFEEAMNQLSPLIAKTFTVADPKRQKELATEIFLLRGMALARRGDDLSARKEFRNVFEVSPALAKEAQKNIFDPKDLVLFQQAEREYLGFNVEFSLAISSEPSGAKIKIDGKEIGVTPEIYKSTKSRVVLEIEKEAYKPIREELQLTQSIEKKDYRLELAGAFVTFNSIPEGAKVFLDGKDTGKATSCQLIVVPFGTHQVKLVKDNYLDLETKFEILEGKKEDTLDLLMAGKSYMFSSKWGDVKSTLFLKPSAIAIDRDNRLLVVDESDVKFKILGADGGVLATGSRGAREVRDLKSPGGVAGDSQGNIYISDAKRDNVLKLDAKGNFIAYLGKSGGGSDGFDTPLGIAVDAGDNLYVADSRNHRVKKYGPDGKLLKIWGKEGTKDGEFMSPKGVSVGPAGRVFVLDSQRVQKFTANGDWMASWGKVGKRDGEWTDPSGIFVDKTRCVYIADTGNHRLQKFDENGRLIVVWGGFGTQNGRLSYPNGIAVSLRGSVYVTERDNNRVQIFVPGTAALGGSQ